MSLILRIDNLFFATVSIPRSKKTGRLAVVELNQRVGTILEISDHGFWIPITDSGNPEKMIE
jgi:hypothetical protein